MKAAQKLSPPRVLHSIEHNTAPLAQFNHEHPAQPLSSLGDPPSCAKCWPSLSLALLAPTATHASPQVHKMLALTRNGEA